MKPEATAIDSNVTDAPIPATAKTVVPKAPKAEKLKANGKAVKQAKEPKSTKVAGGEVSLIGYDPSSSHVQVGGSAKKLIESLPTLNDEQLTGLFRNTVDAERAMFVVRGATAHEIYKRALAEGKKFDKTKGGGVDTLINAIAKDVGIDGTTLYADFKVFDEFGGLLIEQLTTAPDTIMPRDFYVTAMKTSTMARELPSTVLEYFQEQRESTGGYFTDHARRDIKLINAGKSIEDVMILDAQNRESKIAEKNSGKATKKPADKTTSVSLIASEQNINWYKQIIDKYDSFNSWFERKCKEEFGEESVAKKGK